METNKTFEFFIDEKVTSWYRTRFNVQANNQEEAISKAIRMVESGDTELYSWEELESCAERMTIAENYNNPTIELYTSNGEDEVTWDNANGLLINCL
jgi:hypothetical protein